MDSSKGFILELKIQLSNVLKARKINMQLQIVLNIVLYYHPSGELLDPNKREIWSSERAITNLADRTSIAGFLLKFPSIGVNFKIDNLG